MKTGGQRDEFMSEINVVPLVDVMLVVLIIFMVTAPMMVQGVNVALPQAESEPLPAGEESHLVVSIDAGGQVYINDIVVNRELLKEKLFHILENRKSRDVFLKADKSIPYGAVMGVMSDIRGAGVGRLGMLTEPPDTQKTRSKRQ